jgi:hypothetical protein
MKPAEQPGLVLAGNPRSNRGIEGFNRGFRKHRIHQMLS